MAIEPIARIGVLSAPWVQATAVLFEILLGLWLWQDEGQAPWLAALATFGLFSAVAFYTGWIGQASCNCFGPVKVNPWYAFGLDAGLVTALLVARPKRDAGGSSTMSASLRRGVPYAVGVVAVLLLTVGISHAMFGSVWSALAYGRGERVSVTPSVVDVGTGPPGESRRAEVRLTNWTNADIKIVGATQDCSCVVFGDLPLLLAPGETGTLTVEIGLPDKPGVFTRRAGGQHRLRWSAPRGVPHHRTRHRFYSGLATRIDQT